MAGEGATIFYKVISDMNIYYRKIVGALRVLTHYVKGERGSKGAGESLWIKRGRELQEEMCEGEGSSPTLRVPSPLASH